MRKVYFKNSLGVEIEIYRHPYLLQQFSLSPLTDEDITTKGYKQDGETLEESFSEPRDITMQVGLFSHNIDKAVYEFKRIFNPKLGEGTLRLKNSYLEKEITVKVDAEPATSYDVENYGSGYAMLSVSMTAYNPYWYDLEYTRVELVGLTNPFYWDTPTYFSEDTPFYLGSIEGSSKVFDNVGDVPAPLIIEWQGASTNPKITLEDTGKYILLDKVLGENEKLIIVTVYGKKNVYIENITTGVRVKDFSVVNDESTFFSLPLGKSTISFSADSGAENAVVSIKYKNLFIGV
jgi:hypothetical protein